MPPIPKFKVGDIVRLKPYSGDSNSIHNINLSKRAYEETRLKGGELTIRKIRYSAYNDYGVIYSLKGTDRVFHESVLLKVNKKIRY